MLGMCLYCFLEDAIGNIRHKCRVQRYSFTQTFQFLEKWTIADIGMSTCAFLRMRLIMLGIQVHVA